MYLLVGEPTKEPEVRDPNKSYKKASESKHVWKWDRKVNSEDIGVILIP